MRLFVAVSPDGPARAAAAAMQAELRAATSLRARWVAPEGLHVTLAFLGEVTPALVPDLQGALAAAAGGVGGFGAGLGRAGAFPSPGRARVLWIGIEPGGERLGVLAAAVRTALGPFPVAREEHPFRPHLTIARVRPGSRDQGLADRLAALRPAGAVRWDVRSVTLFASTLGPGGARHDPVAELPLAGG